MDGVTEIVYKSERCGDSEGNVGLNPLIYSLSFGTVSCATSQDTYDWLAYVRWHMFFSKAANASQRRDIVLALHLDAVLMHHAGS